jgi:excisionase family DNA binding protein
MEWTKPMEQLLLTPEETGHVLRLNRARTYTMLASGALPSIRIGRSVRVPVEALRAWIAQQTVTPSPTTPTESPAVEALLTARLEAAQSESAATVARRRAG